MNNDKQREYLVRYIQNVQFKLMRTATLENHTHAERNTETRDIVKMLEHIIDMVKLDSDEFNDIGDIPF